MNKRLGFVGIILEDRKKSAEEVNRVLTEFGDLMAGRMGIPHAREEQSVIVLIVNASTDEVGSLTGRLGKIAGVSVKSALGKEK